MKHRLTTGRRDDGRSLPIFARCTCGADVNFADGRELARWETQHLTRKEAGR